jgi:plastocyanin
MIRPLALVALAACLAGCTSGLKRPVVSADAVVDLQGVQRLEVGMHSYYFEPNRIVVHAGRPVELRIHNRSIITPHNFTIADSTMHVSVDKWGFGVATARFTPTTPGEYRFYCHVDGHGRKKGMTGTLVVLP